LSDGVTCSRRLQFFFQCTPAPFPPLKRPRSGKKGVLMHNTQVFGDRFQAVHILLQRNRSRARRIVLILGVADIRINVCAETKFVGGHDSMCSMSVGCGECGHVPCGTHVTASCGVRSALWSQQQRPWPRGPLPFPCVVPLKHLQTITYRGCCSTVWCGA